MAADAALGALLPAPARYPPGAAGSAILGVDAATLLAPGIAVAVLAGWATLGALLGNRSMEQRDIT